MVLFVAPSEPPRLKALGISTPTPEEYGADYLWVSEGFGTVGIQRKEFPGDFLSSVTDGRLNKEYLQMEALDLAVLLLEGKGRWTVTGQLIEDFTTRRWTREHNEHYLASVMMRGIQVHHTENMTDTERFIEGFREWTDRPEHNSLYGRPGVEALFGQGGWAEITNRHYQRYLHMGLPGVGIKWADAILDQLGVVLSLDTNLEDLANVESVSANGRVVRLGEKRARRILAVFNRED